MSSVDAKYFDMFYVDLKMRVSSADFEKWKWGGLVLRAGNMKEQPWGVKCLADFEGRVSTNF